MRCPFAPWSIHCARYSPEYQAICWAQEHDAEAEFFDLPSDVFLGLQEAEIEWLEKRRSEESQSPGAGEASRRLPWRFPSRRGACTSGSPI